MQKTCFSELHGRIGRTLTVKLIFLESVTRVGWQFFGSFIGSSGSLLTLYQADNAPVSHPKNLDKRVDDALMRHPF